MAAELRHRYPGRLIFTLGRHVSYKGFNVLIEAMTAVDESARLLIGGTGPLTESWKALADRLGVGHRVHFLGLLEDSALPAYYQACDVFCLPAITQAEAFGIVQVEAMASGKPVVSTRLGNGVDVVNQDGMTGLVVPPGASGPLADALNRLLRDPVLAAAMGQRGRIRAATEFSSTAMGNRTLEIYQRALVRASD